MGYDQKALEKLFAKKPDTSVIDNIPAAEPVAEPEHTPVVELAAEKLPRAENQCQADKRSCQYQI